ncbi:uncharacterized protein BBA_09459 [Beauveria bassiana ARSEF 2860]|uniref:Uncharacterized protein n=1 Tax=Beauveria bassiana (strain ARSEF 2860) TaxID=655819 RepID=J5JCM2_BEAB2|nr:uncharacterized protein BBA_09459 [Beauveria bassiana ARSEF 2860]EJP61616.1 hypothetical protein BBA_09459 [Beauveria bassiana ARSEF 2860]
MTAKHGESAPILQRTYFTPAVPTSTQEPAAAAGEKKRNKLGYHRTVIACNCIFCPVDQPPTVDSQGKPAGPRTGSSTAHSHFSSPALAFRHSVDMASESMYGMGPKQDPNGHAASAIAQSSVGYLSVIGEGVSMPIAPEQDFSVSTGTSLAWGTVEPSPVTLPGSKDKGYEWCPYGSGSDSTEQISPFASGSTTPATWVTTMPRTPQFTDWNWNNGILSTAQAISASFSGEVMSHPQHQFVPVSSKSPYNGAVPNMGNTFTLPMNQASVAGHLPSQACDPSGGWQPQQQSML